MKDSPQVPPENEVTTRRSSSSWLASRRLAGIGSEIVASIIGLGLIGYAADRWIWKSATPSWGTVIGLILGILGGLYNAVKKARSYFEAEDDNDNGSDSDNGNGNDEPTTPSQHGH